MSKTYFISGHRDVTQEEFDLHYKPLIDNALKEDSQFVIGDYQGADYLAQIYLENKIDKSKVKIYHMFLRPKYYISGFETKGGYLTHEDRDSAMTKASDADIAWVRKGKEKSGTAINLQRRIKYASAK